jgi:glycosyltransferase involved in cell wall biosynthesis
MEITASNAAPNYRIAFFTNTYRPFVGGVARSVELFQQYLKRRGDQIVVYAPQYDDEDEDKDGTDVRRLASIRHFNNTDFSLPLPLSLTTMLHFNEEQFDIVHVHHPFLLGEMGMHLARQHRLPLVFTYHTQYEQYLHYVPFPEDTAARTILKHTREFCDFCDLVIAPTRDVERQLRDRGVASRIEVLPTGIELKRFDESDGAGLRHDWGIGSDAPVLVHVGRLAAEKNLPYLMGAGLEALRRRPDAHWIIAGDGPIRAQLETRAAGEPQARGRTHFLGQRTGRALIDVYRTANLFIFASKTETQGMVVAEAMAAGNPVIALDANGVRDLVRDGENGRLLPADADEAAFAEAVVDALARPERLAAWGDAARRTAAALDMPLLAERLHACYASLKLLPNHRLKQETMSFGLIRNYFETVWEKVERWFTEL